MRCCAQELVTSPVKKCRISKAKGDFSCSPQVVWEAAPSGCCKIHQRDIAVQSLIAKKVLDIMAAKGVKGGPSNLLVLI